MKISARTTANPLTVCRLPPDRPRLLQTFDIGKGKCTLVFSADDTDTNYEGANDEYAEFIARFFATFDVSFRLKVYYGVAYMHGGDPVWKFTYCVNDTPCTRGCAINGDELQLERGKADFFNAIIFQLYFSTMSKLWWLLSMDEAPRLWVDSPLHVLPVDLMAATLAWLPEFRIFSNLK